jgi:hypothetical protein
MSTSCGELRAGACGWARSTSRQPRLESASGNGVEVMNDALAILAVVYIDVRGVIALALVIALYAFVTWLGTRETPPQDGPPKA